MIPETFEDIAATALARWLSARDEAGRLPTPPADLDPEVVEAVYTLRPDLAPAPTMVLEDIWQTLDEAPRLQRWLEGGSSEGIDAQVREAVYALQPQRAPASTVTVDEILATLQGAPKLARFLEDGVTDLDDDVREAVFALRPDLAPPPRVTIDDILSTVHGAPKLAHFLDDSDGEAGDTLDPEVLEAVYALRPELAPGPKVEMEDIFARIASGPFAKKAAPVVAAPVVAAPVVAAAVEPEREIANTPMKPREVARQPEVANRPIRRRRGWIAAFLLAGGGGAAVFMAAAAAMLLVVGVGIANREAPPMAPSATATEVAAAPPVAGPAAAEDPVAADAKSVARRSIAEADRGAEAKQEEMAPEPAASKDGFASKGDSVNFGAAPQEGGGLGGGAAIGGPAPKPAAMPAPVVDSPKVARSEAPESDDQLATAKKAPADAPSAARTAAFNRKVTAPDPAKEDAFTQAAIRYADSEAPRSMKVRDYRQAGDAYAKVVAESTASVGVVQWYAAKAGDQYLQANDAATALKITDGAAKRGKSPQLPAALRVKGDALAALGRAAEAEEAWASAAK